MANPCKYRCGPFSQCAYYPTSDGLPSGRCWALVNSDGCRRTQNRDRLIEAVKKSDPMWHQKLIAEREQELSLERNGGVLLSGFPVQKVSV